MWKDRCLDYNGTGYRHCEGTIMRDVHGSRSWIKVID